MSNTNQSVAIPISETPVPVGGLPGSRTADVEGQRWEKLCGELLAEREMLRDELANLKSERDQYLKSLYHYIRKDAPPLTFTKEEVFAAIQNEQSFGDLVAELQKQYGQEK